MSKKVVITGTSRGIGFELVKAFADARHQVLALSRNSEPVDKLGFRNVESMAFDLSNDKDFDSVETRIKNSWNTVDILIHNAGMLINKPFSETSTQDYMQVFQTNVFGVAELSRRLIPYMNKDGHVVIISSMGGVQGSLKFPGLAAYSSSKGAVITLTELLAEEYKETGPRFNALALGSVQTQMLEEAFPGYQASTSADEMANYIYHFAISGHRFQNGKILQVSNSTP